jgi:hypothetical protein
MTQMPKEIVEAAAVGADHRHFGALISDSSVSVSSAHCSQYSAPRQPSPPRPTPISMLRCWLAQICSASCVAEPLFS